MANEKNFKERNQINLSFAICNHLHCFVSEDQTFFLANVGIRYLEESVSLENEKQTSLHSILFFVVPFHLQRIIHLTALQK